MGKVETLATEMGVSASDLRSFVAGISIHVNAGLQLEDAIRAHVDGMRRMYEAAATLSNRESWQSKARAFVVDAFFPAAQVQS